MPLWVVTFLGPSVSPTAIPQLSCPLCCNCLLYTSYLVEQTGRNLYSLEELSWFVYHNICLAGRSFFNERLCQWMEKELDCGDLAKRIRKGISTETSLTNLIVAVVGASDLYDSVQLTELSDRIRAMDSMQEQERLKLQADELLDLSLIHILQWCD